MATLSEQKPLILNPAEDLHARAIARLQSESVGWFVSIRSDGFPHAVPVWFLWHNDEILVLSEPGAVKVRNVRGNGKVVLHLEAGADEEQLTVLQGIATIDAEPTLAWVDRIGEEYGQKYASGLAHLKLTMHTMAEQYSTVLRIVPTKLTAW